MSKNLSDYNDLGSITWGDLEKTVNEIVIYIGY